MAVKLNGVMDLWPNAHSFERVSLGRVDWRGIAFQGLPLLSRGDSNVMLEMRDRSHGVARGTWDLNHFCFLFRPTLHEMGSIDYA